MRDVVRNGKLLADCLLRACEDFDYDGITVDLDTATSAEVLGCKVTFRDDEPAVVERAAIDSLADVETLRGVSIGPSSGRWDVYTECIARLNEQIGRDRLIITYCDQGPFSLAAIARGIEAFLIDLTDDTRETALRSLLEITTEVTTYFAHLLSDHGAHAVVLGDSLASCDVVSPEIYLRYALPYERRVVNSINLAGGISGVHICGNVTPILGSLCGIGLSLVEIDYKCNLPIVRCATADKVVVRGTLDPAAVLRFGTPAMVRAKTEEVIAVLGSRGRLIISSGCDMTQTPRTLTYAKWSMLRTAIAITNMRVIRQST